MRKVEPEQAVQRCSGKERRDENGELLEDRPIGTDELGHEGDIKGRAFRIQHTDQEGLPEQALQRPRLRDTIGGNAVGGGGPQFVGQPDQVGRAGDLQEGEQECRGRQDRAGAEKR